MKREENNLKFFHNLMAYLKHSSPHNIGIITDKDGTLLLNTELLESLEKLKSKDLDFNIDLIVNSGRTVADMLNCLRTENLPINCFDYVAGDNGGVCLDVTQNRELFKYVMDKKDINSAFSFFADIGGQISNIRMTDGSKIYAYPSDDVMEYYKSSDGVIYKKDIDKCCDIDVTKVTFAASKKQIEQLNHILRTALPNYRSHIGSTKFPANSKGNYRLDFTGMHTKGTVVKYFREKLNLDTCILLGNDLNDIPMFSEGLSNGDFIVIANHPNPEITNLILTYLQEECRLKGINWEHANLLLLKRDNVNFFLKNLNSALRTFNVKPKKEKFKIKCWHTERD